MKVSGDSTQETANIVWPEILRSMKKILLALRE